MSDDSLTLTSPTFTTLPECMPGAFSWEGGVPPYDLYFGYQRRGGIKMEDLKQTNYTTSFPFPAGSKVVGRLTDAENHEVPINFSVVSKGGNKDCLPSNKGIEVPNPADVQSYSSRGGGPSFQLKANGLSRKYDLRLSSCNLIEVDVLSGQPPYSIGLWPQSEKPLPYVGYFTNANITFPLPYPPGVVFDVRIDDGRGYSQESDSILTLSGGTESCILGPRASTSTLVPQGHAAAHSSLFPAATIGKGTLASSVGLVAFAVTMLAWLLLVVAFRQYRKRQPKVFLAEDGGDGILYKQDIENATLPTVQDSEKAVDC